MRNGTPGFTKERLVAARDSRGLSQVALADLINRTSSSISRWEAGAQSPEPDALEAMAVALNVPVAFFLQQDRGHGDHPMFFRSMASTTQSIRKRTSARLRWAQDISHCLQDWVDLPEVHLPRIQASDHREIRDEDIENAAAACRNQWNLGTGPISDVLLAVENAGIVVVQEEVGTAKMDGLSNWSTADGRPYMLIATDKATCVRSRMDAAHELAHLVLHKDISPEKLKSPADFKEIERQAFHFAGSFLLPAETFSSEVWSPSLNAFLALKERWKTSVGAMIMRCTEMGMLTEEYRVRLWKHYSSRGWRKEEPLDDILELERPRLLSRSIRLLLDEHVRSRADLLAEFRLNPTDVESLCGLPRGFMTSEAADVVAMPKLRRDVTDQSSTATVVPFRK